MKHEGVPRRKKLSNELKGFPTMASIMKGEAVNKYKRRERKPRTTKNVMGEKALEKRIIISLKMKKCEVAKSGEQSTYNSHFVLNGMSDLIVFIPNGGVIFMEVKQEKYRTQRNGGLRASQVKFRELCKRCNLRYVVVYNLDEARKAVDDENI